MSQLSELIGKLETSLAEAKTEVAEFDSGKKAAAGRVRKIAQDCKNVWQQVRVTTMAQLKAMPTKTKAPKA